MSETPTPSPERLTELFVALARVPSHSRKEGAVADVVRRSLETLGVDVHEDEAGAAIGGECGNLWCRVGDAEQDPSIAIGAHLDTVMPSPPIEPVLGEDGVLRNAGNGILGADDKAAIAAMIHATELLIGCGRPYPAFELFFTVCEEQGLLGAKHLSPAALASPLAAVLDSTGPVGGIVVKAPSRKGISAVFRGKAAHAGVEPEAGRSAIVAAAKAVAAMSLGRIDAETTANIGTIDGGVATNIVPDTCRIEGECRGHDDERLADVAGAMVDAIEDAAAEVGVDVEVALDQEFRAFSLGERSLAVRLGKAAVGNLGLQPRLVVGGGGSDANVLNERGIPTINLDSGMMRVHSPEEYLPLGELTRLCELVLSLIRLAPEYRPGRPASKPAGI